MALALIGCGGEGTGKILTVAEYASMCGSIESVASTDGQTTWGDVVSSLESALKKLRDHEPPEVLREYHLGQLAALERVVEFAKDRDANEMADPFAVFSDRSVLASSMAMVATGYELPLDVQETLEEHGCF